MANVMVDFEKILVPVDFSEHSKFAAQKALSLAQVCQTELYFLHVGDTAKSSAERLCAFLQNITSNKKVALKKFVAQGSPASVILSTAQKLQVDAVIMGHRDISGLKQLVQGSIAAKVLRESICPVLIIKKKKPQEFGGYVLPQIRNIEEAFQADNILVPLDFSLASKQAFRYATYLATRYNSTIYTLTVYDKKFKEEGEDRKKHTAIIVHKRKIQLWKAFPELIRTTPYNRSEIRVKRLLLDGDPFSKIESVCQKKEIDLVIMGTNGRTGLEHLLIGSVAEKVLRGIACPVMTIRARREALRLR